MTCQVLGGVVFIKISSKVEESVWQDLREVAQQDFRSISRVLTEAIEEYVRRRRMRPEVFGHLSDSIEENNELGRLLGD